MNTLTADGQYPGSQYNLIAPVMSAVMSDIVSRNIVLPGFTPECSQLPPIQPGEAYGLRIFDRLAHVIFKRMSPNGIVELRFGTGGYQFGPVRVESIMPLPSQYIDLLSLLTVCWITFQLDRLNLTPWSLDKIKSYYPQTVATPGYSNALRIFCHNVLLIAEFSFTDSKDHVGFATDYDDQ